jgi:hypothetical protein
LRGYRRGFGQSGKGQHKRHGGAAGQKAAYKV